MRLFNRPVRWIGMPVFMILMLSAATLIRAQSVENNLIQGRLNSRIDRLEGGIQAQEAIRAVKRLQYTYGYYLDMGLWSDLAGLFANDAVVNFQTVAVRGRDKISSHFMARAGRESAGLSEGQLSVHLMMQPIVTLEPDGRSARGTWHEMALLGQFGETATWVGGVYENEYILEDNVWKIGRLSYFEQYRGSYDEWGHRAPANWDIPYHFEAAHVGVTIPPEAIEALSKLSSDLPAEARLRSLAPRIERLNDETQVRNLQHSYGYYMDRKMWNDVADLFEENGTFEEGLRGVYEGKARIQRALEVFYGPYPLRKGELFDHINLSTVVTVARDGVNARARIRQLSMLGLDGKYARWEVGTFENEFVKDDGVWKIKAVRYFPEMIADYDEGWANDAGQAPAIHKELPPDRKPAQSYDIYPGLHYVALHYVNPATGRVPEYPPGTVTRLNKPVLSSDLPETATIGNAEDPLEMLADLEHGLDAAIAVDAVENLNSSYGYYIDESAWDSMADTFASNGSKEITGVGVYVGRERIRKILNLRGPRGGRTPDFFTIHQLTQPVIHISEDGGSARARLRLFQCGGNADGTSGSWIGGIYENTAVKENGEWKFGVQDLQHTFNASYRNGWARVSAAGRSKVVPGKKPAGRDVPGGGIQQGLGGAASPFQFMNGFPPDHPIRSRQYTFPEIVEPAFHYRNPVTGRMPSDLLQ
ncbi:MAG: nuclear transport factor 2 family protein [Acidobacteriota bacterium]